LPTPLSQIADNLKIEVEVVEGVLKQLQQAEPVGLFARNHLNAAFCEWRHTQNRREKPS
jgi:DNA-directed RNA polymerase specialized sigma54-like protein